MAHAEPTAHVSMRTAHVSTTNPWVHVASVPADVASVPTASAHVATGARTTTKGTPLLNLRACTSLKSKTFGRHNPHSDMHMYVIYGTCPRASHLYVVVTVYDVVFWSVVSYLPVVFNKPSVID